MTTRDPRFDAHASGVGLRPATRGPSGSRLAFINDPMRVVDEMLDGFVAANSNTVRLLAPRCVSRAQPRSSGPVVIAGGGSGHEPAFLGYVGDGLLDAAVIGDVFASPPVKAIASAIDTVDRGDGVLLLIGNYAGDVLNFRLAAEQSLRAGHDVRLVVITDDVGLGRFEDVRARRGMAGSFFVWKTCGAMTARGVSLDDLETLARRVNARLRTVAVAHTAPTLPGADSPVFGIGEGLLEFGVGHGEPGSHRIPAAPVDSIVGEIVTHLMSPELPPLAGARVAVLVNGLGSVALMELYIAYRSARQELVKRNIGLGRSYVGNIYTTMNMGGFSISTCELDDELESLLAAPASAPHFREGLR